jgi:hypothetical protein
MEGVTVFGQLVCGNRNSFSLFSTFPFGKSTSRGISVCHRLLMSLMGLNDPDGFTLGRFLAILGIS